MTKMTKKQMVQEILEDMYRYNPVEQVDRRFKGYLNRLPKAEVAEIHSIRCGGGKAELKPFNWNC